MSAVIELLPTVEQPTAAAPFAATNLILGAAEALGRLARIESIAAGKSIEEARICGHAVTVSRLALAIDELVTNQQVLVEALQAFMALDASFTRGPLSHAQAIADAYPKGKRGDMARAVVKARTALARAGASA